MAQITDFSRSFLTFRTDLADKQSLTQSHPPRYQLNNARIALDCVCELTELATGAQHRYVLGASCKSERVGVDSGVWLDPNADFCILASPDEYLIFKTWISNAVEVLLEPAALGRQPERQVGLVRDTYVSLRVDVRGAEARQLATIEQVVAATLDNQPLVGRIEYEDAGYRVCIDHPVKTMNVNERDGVYQTDTGPLAVPDFARARENGLLVSVFELAFSAFNRPEWVELLIQEPTPVIGAGGRALDVTASHYARTRRVEGASNQLFAL